VGLAVSVSGGIMFSLKNRDDLKYFVLGATILGTGGGGDPREGLRLLEEALTLRGKIDIVKVDELSEDAIIVVPYFVGTIAPGAEPKKAVRIEEPIKRAFEEMNKMLGGRVSAVLATEMGGLNTAVPLYVAAKVGLPVVDGDLLGRAAPELHQCTVHVYDIPMYPSVIVTSTGNIVIVREYSDIDDYEAIARYLSVLDGKSAAVVDTPLDKERAAKAIVRDTISLAYRLGKEVYEAREEGKDPVEAIVRVLGGWKIFEGTVEKYEWRDEKGFLVGETEVRGVGRWEGHKLRTWIKNEHIMAWLDDKPIVMPPDLISFVLDDGEPITNSDLREGYKVHVIAARAPEVWRTRKGLELFGPRHFGFDYDYVPVEELVQRHGIA
jgi:hypothetical protein